MLRGDREWTTSGLREIPDEPKGHGLAVAAMVVGDQVGVAKKAKTIMFGRAVGGPRHNLDVWLVHEQELESYINVLEHVSKGTTDDDKDLERKCTISISHAWDPAYGGWIDNEEDDDSSALRQRFRKFRPIESLESAPSD